MSLMSMRNIACQRSDRSLLTTVSKANTRGRQAQRAHPMNHCCVGPKYRSRPRTNLTKCNTLRITVAIWVGPKCLAHQSIAANTLVVGERSKPIPCSNSAHPRANRICVDYCNLGPVASTFYLSRESVLFLGPNGQCRACVFKRWKTSGNTHPLKYNGIIRTEPPGNPPHLRARIITETFEFPAIHLTTQAVLILADSNLTTGLVVPVYNAVGGLHLSQDAHARRHGAMEQIKPYCYVSEFTHIPLPDGFLLKINNERIMCPEAIFNPALLGGIAVTLPVFGGI